MFLKPITSALLAGTFALTAGVANAATMFSFDEASFNAGNTFTSTEDFETEGFAPGTASGTSAASVVYGDFTLDVNTGDVVEVGAGFAGVPSAMAGANTFVASLNVLLPANTTAFGGDLFSLFDGSIFTVSVFDTFDNLLASTGIAVGNDTSEGRFFGVFSDEAIGRVNFFSNTNQAELVDNLRAGSHITPVPLPASGWMLIAGVGGLVALRRRRKS
jgi:hypothetical protein